MDGTRTQQVSSHVQLGNRKKSPSEHEDLRMNDPGPVASQSLSTPRRGGEIQPWRIDRPPRQRKDAGTTSAADRYSSAQSTSSFMQAGDSSSYAALPASVDNVSRRILSWLRDDGLSCMFPLERAAFGVYTPSTKRVWERVITSLNTPGLADSQLASACVMMGQQTQSDVIQNMGLKLKGNAYSVIQQRMNDPVRRNHPDSMRMILDMFWADQVTNNQTAAQTHLSLLVGWAETQDPSKVDVDLRTELLAADVGLAGSKMALPLIDASKWAAEEQLEGWRTDFEQEGLVLRLQDVDETITDARLRLALSALKELAAVAELAVSGRVRSPSVFQWIALRLLSCESELLRISLERSSYLPDDASGDEGIRSSRQISCAALTGLAWIWTTLVSKLRHGKEMLVSRLQTAQRSAFADLGHTESRSFALWSFHVGTLLEKRIEEDTGESKVKGWHLFQFELLSAGVTGGDLSSITEILSSFVYSETLNNLRL